MNEMQEKRSARYQGILGKIAEAARGAGRDPASIHLIAVSKRQPASAIRELYELGHRDFGENYVQELVEKADELRRQGCDGIRWHFIGHLQTNKARSLVPDVSFVHSLDSERVAAELARRWRSRMEAGSGRLPVFLEVNISGEASKSGLAPGAVAPLAAWIGERAPELQLLGLMCIPEASDDPARLRGEFSRLRELEATCRPGSQGMLSMGMSSDYELAIAEGATHVRIGTALFGPRA